MMRYWGPGAGPFAHHYLGGMGIAGMVLMAILWIAIIAAIVIGIRALILHSRANRAGVGAPAAAYPTGGGPATSAAPPATLLAILEERYARGEIGREDFLQRKQDLGLAAPAAQPATETEPQPPNPPEASS